MSPNQTEPQSVSITKAELLRRLKPGMKLILAYTTFQGACDKPRVVEKANVRQLVLKTPEEKLSYYDFQKGDKISICNSSFTIEDVENHKVVYFFDNRKDANS